MNGNQPAGDLSPFRAALACVALIGGLLGLAGLYFVPIPEGNREPLLLRPRPGAGLGQHPDRL